LSTNGLLENNIIMKVVGRGKDIDSSYKDLEGGIVFGYANEMDDIFCKNVTLSSNIVANARTAAFWAMGHKCSETNTNFFNNTAHSN